MELGQRKDYLPSSSIQTIYLGGGTPSLLSEEELQLVFNTIAKHFEMQADAEITLEANPDDINKPSLNLWKNVGINRLSIGLQSFNEHELIWMNRAHNALQSLESVKLSQDAGYDNLSVDLIYGSRFLSDADWQSTLQKTLDLNVQHISAYNLTIEEKTKLGVEYYKGLEPAVNEEKSSCQFYKMKEILEGSGFIHYEVSNFAKPGYMAKHNSAYWQQQPYLGLGPSAHSFNGHSRQWNVKNNSSYIKLVTQQGVYFEKEELGTTTRYNEYVLTRLRTIWGCNIREIEAWFGKEKAFYFKQQIEREKNFLKEANGIYTLTPEGLLMADGIASSLFIV